MNRAQQHAKSHTHNAQTLTQQQISGNTISLCAGAVRAGDEKDEKGLEVSETVEHEGGLPQR